MFNLASVRVKIWQKENKTVSDDQHINTFSRLIYNDNELSLFRIFELSK